MKLRIVRRWGSAAPGDTVTVEDDQQARWLIDNSFAVRSNQVETATSGAVAPGADGPDVKAGGDWTRRRPTTRRGNREGNLAWPAHGSPVQYTAGIDPNRGHVGEGSGDGDESQPDRPSTKISGSGRRRQSPKA